MVYNLMLFKSHNVTQYVDSYPNTVPKTANWPARWVRIDGFDELYCKNYVVTDPDRMMRHEVIMPVFLQKIDGKRRGTLTGPHFFGLLNV